MSTYNGEKYIAKQLDSIKNQTRKADEVIIIDDCSTDNTVDILNKYIVNNNLLNWKVYHNETNKGWKKNFFEGIKKTTGDVVLFSDQDDIWFLDKIEVFENALNENPNINVIASGENIWYGTKINNKQSNIIGKSVINFQNNKKNFWIKCSGCTMGFRRSYYNKIYLYYCDGWAHDDFFWKMALLDNSFLLLHGSTILHRIHGNNESRKKRNKKTAISYLEDNILICEQLESYMKDEGANKLFKKNKRIIAHYKKALKYRLQLVRDKKLLSAIKLLLYLDTYKRKRQYIGDILLSINIKIH